MDPKKPFDFFSKLGVPAGVLSVAKVAIPILLVVGALALAWWIARKKKAKSEPPSVSGSSDASGASGGGSANRLQTAWRRFLAQLPRVYRRSILNFEHYVVLGSPGSGKSRLIDACSDWRRQAKQFVGSQSFDDELQVYLASWAVITEIPGRLLSDYSEGCKRALERLWAPLYARRSPTVLVVVDVIRLREATPDEITDLAERIRGKINVISRIRRAAIEVRVVLTHLDELAGFLDFAGLCREEGIALRVGLVRGKEKPSAEAQLDAWFAGNRGHLARSLVTMPTAAFRSAVEFVRISNSLAPSVGRFVDALFDREALSIDPICGGVFLSGDAAALPNPLRNASDTGPGPDPRARHKLAVGGVAVAAALFMLLAFAVQRGAARDAASALRTYDASNLGAEDERQARKSIRGFGDARFGLLTYPDFFEARREAVRAQLSRGVREQLLIPRLRAVSRSGAVDANAAAYAWRKSLYYLAVIHSDRADGMDLSDPRNMNVWAQMTDLPPDLITDYLRTTDFAYRVPVSFQLANPSLDGQDGVTLWTSFLRDLEATVDGKSISAGPLQKLQARAGALLETFARFEHDERTNSILGEIDVAANLTPPKNASAGRAQLQQAYTPRYEGLASSGVTSDVYAAREDLKAIILTVRKSSLATAAPETVTGLTAQLTALQVEAADTTSDRTKKVKFGETEFVFESRKWADVIRAGKAVELVSKFVAPRLAPTSVFFSAQTDALIRPEAWNPGNDGTSMFLGKAEIEARYTRAAFDAHVLAAVTKLSEVVDKASVTDELKHTLGEFIKDHVETYAAEYKTQSSRFFLSFGVRASSSQELRVVLGQMVADRSAFNDFLATTEKQIGIQTTHPWLAPMDEALTDFVNLHRVLDATGGAPEIVKYKEILKQLLTDLGPPVDGAIAPPAAEAAAPSAGKPTLETGLTAAGVLTLKTMRGDKGSYPAMVRNWLAGVGLRDPYQRPFVLPTEQLTGIGLREIEAEVSRAWEREVLAGLGLTVTKFPFDPTSKDEVRAKDLAAFFEPQNGAFFDAFRRYFEPVSDFGDGKAFGELASLRGRIRYPARMYAIVNAVAAVSSRLFDPTGQPKLLEVRVGTVPFDHGTNPGAALTLAYLTVGDTSIFNFNQKAGVTTLQLDWTKEQPSQVGLQLTDLDTKANKFPTPISSPPSYFSLFRLFSLATATPARGEAGTTVYSWTPGGDKAGVRARFASYGDPMGPFLALRQSVGRPTENVAVR